MRITWRTIRKTKLNICWRKSYIKSIVIIFIYGFCVTFLRLCKRLIKIDYDNNSYDLWRGQYEFQDLLFLSLIIVPIFLTIVFKATLYNAWRHLYFIYPFIILVGINGLRGFYISLKIHNLKFITKIVDSGIHVIFDIILLILIFFRLTFKIMTIWSRYN